MIQSQDKMEPTSDQTTASFEHALPVIVRLQAMRQRARTLLLVNGLALLVLGGAGALLILFFLDWTFWFPSFIRLCFTLAWLALLAWIISKYLWAPLFAPFSDLHIATKIEERFPQFEDRLTSSVSFISEEYTLHDALQEKLIERTEHIARGIAMEEALTAKPVRRMAVLACLPLTVMAVIFWLNAGWLNIGSSRFLLPFLPTHWPKTVHIQPLTGDLTIASGTSVVVSMEVTKGQNDSLRAYLHLQRPDKPPARIVMRREGPPDAVTRARYAWTINTITEDMRYWFQAGDDSTADAAASIRVVNRPQVTDMHLSIILPPYAARPDPISIPNGQYEIDLIASSTLEVSFKSNKPLEHDPDGAPLAWISTADGGKIAARYDDSNGGVLVVAVSPRSDREYRIHILGRDGFENDPGDTISVRVRKDAPPSVSIIEPVEVLEVTQQATVRIAGSVRDDLGVSSIELSGTIHPSGAPFAIPISRYPTDSAASTTTRVEHTWALADLNLNVGDRVEYTLRAWDNRSSEDLQPQVGQAHVMQLLIVSEAQFTTGVADELARMAERLKRYLKQQQQLLDDTRVHGQALQESPEFDPDAQLLRLSARQRTLARRIATIRKNVESLRRQLRRNRVERVSEKQRAELFADRLRSAVEPAMREAASTLNDARGLAERDAQSAGIQRAAEFEQAAIDAIRALLDQLTLWHDYHSALANLRDLIDLQQQVGRETAMLQDQTVGQRVDDLPEDLGGALDRNARNQEAVTAAIERALAELIRLQTRLRPTQPADARALLDTERTLKTNEALARSRSAAQAIRDNQTAQAQADQSSIERTLADAIQKLELREQRKLAELSKKIADAEDLVRRILEQQQQLRTATSRLGQDQADAALPELAGRQRKLRQSTARVIDSLDQVPESGQAGLYLDRAAGAMARSTDALYDLQADLATQAQDEAVEHLEQALAWLEQLRRKSEQAIKRAKLLAIKRELLNLRTRQADINNETAEIVDRVLQAGRRTRIDVRRAKKQGRVQRDVLDKLNEVHDKLAETAVYSWVMDRIARAMERSRDMLQDARFEKPLTRAQHRAVSFLDQLIDALKQAEAMVEEQFAEGGGMAGGGQLQMGEQKPVPTVAELIVLKGIQQNIIERTRDLAGAMDPDRPTEEQLQEVRMLGAEEHELKQLTVELTRKAMERQ